MQNTFATTSKTNFTIQKLPLFLGLLAFVFVSLAATSCKSTKNLAASAKQQASMLIIGSGGGVTGQIQQYEIKPDGQVFRVKTFPQDTMAVNQLDENQVGQLKSNIKVLGIDQARFNHPGNRYFFLTLRDENNKERTLKWGSADHEIDTNIQLFYDNTMQLILTNSNE